MISIERILCPVDFSEFSRRALDYAVAVAQWYEAKVTALHVFRSVPTVDVIPSLGVGGVHPALLPEADRKKLLALLEGFVAQAPGGVPIETTLEQAPDARDEILAQSAVLKADLLVMGSHGRSGFERLLLGSVTEKVLRKSVCPVMVVPPHAAAPAHPVPFKRILCSIDFSDSSLRALTFALDLAQEADARLTLLHVIELPPEFREFGDGDGNMAGVSAAAEAERLRRLRALVPTPAREYCTVLTQVCEGSAHREILRVAAEEQSEVIVMGAHGRGALDLMLFGSNTHAVIRGAICPVLTVRAT